MNWEMLWVDVGRSMVFGVIGIVLLMLGFLTFELITRRLDVQDQLNKGNIAVGIVTGALLLSIAYIAGLVVH